jgi:hypothetical protein
MMQFVAILLSLLATATAFAPMGRVSSRTALKMSFDEESIGILPPVGYWDPLGLAADGDVETFNRRRAVELKHGRVAMLAVTGYLIQSIARFPGEIDLDGTTFESIPNGVGAIGAVPAWGWIQIIGSVGYWELVGWADRQDEKIGDFGFYPGKAPEGDNLTEQRTKEIQNGRLAMLAIMELLTHDVARPAGEGLFVLHHL